MWTGRSFDADAVWRLAERERTTSITLVGDAMGRPLADALAANPGRYDLSGLFALANTGAPMTDLVRDDFARLLPAVFVIDSYGASEMGHNGTEAGERRVFRLTDDTAVLDDDLEPVKPGSEVVGRIARRGPIPLRYHKDPDKTAATFRTDARGVRWVVPGDMATVQADGTVRLLGRGNMVINTGGEKVFPEEVENAVKSHPEVEDVLVVGVPDTRFGERVAALVALRPGAAGDLDSITAHCRRGVAGYKVPKDVFVVDAISRSPAGKPDYRWARSVAARLAAASSTQSSPASS
jgi:acyl-CoA synthetase (AMP-forming)/AMP-acid ligase II